MSSGRFTRKSLFADIHLHETYVLERQAVLLQYPLHFVHTAQNTLESEVGGHRRRRYHIAHTDTPAAVDIVEAVLPVHAPVRQERYGEYRGRQHIIRVKFSHTELFKLPETK